MSDSIIDATEFQAIMRRAWKKPFRRAEFDEMPLPEGYDADEVWRQLLIVRRSHAYVSPIGLATPQGIVSNWHTITEDLHHVLFELSVFTCTGSHLDAIASERQGKRFITQQYVEDLLTNLEFDGYPAEYEEVRAVLMDEGVPVTNGEIIARNFHGIMNTLGTLQDAPFDAAILNDLYQRLTENVTVEDAREMQKLPRSPLEEHYAGQAGRVQPSSLDMPIRVANGELVEDTRHPIMISMLVNCQFWRTMIYPSCNNLMGCIASRLYLLQKGFPVFRYVPKIRIMEKWKQGMYADEVECSFSEALHSAESDMDWTLYYDTVMRLVLHEVRAMERSLSNRKAYDDRAIEGIKRVPYLSHRQQDILKQAVLVPETEFTISAQKKNFGIAYSTARADLEKLAETGLLDRVINGSAYAYHAVSDLKRRLAEA